MTMNATVVDTWLATWDVDGRLYLWLLLEAENGEQFVQRYRPS